MKNKKFCENCQSIYYYTYECILKFNVDEYRNYRDVCFPQKASMNLNLDECFYCYKGGYHYTCQDCGNLMGKKFKIICTPANVLIIAFNRNIHRYICDIDFELSLNIRNHIS